MSSIPAGRSHSDIEETATDLRGQTAGNGLKSKRNLARAHHVLIFEDAERQIEFSVVIL